MGQLEKVKVFCQETTLYRCFFYSLPAIFANIIINPCVHLLQFSKLCIGAKHLADLGYVPATKKFEVWKECVGPRTVLTELNF